MKLRAGVCILAMAAYSAAQAAPHVPGYSAGKTFIGTPSPSPTPSPTPTPTPAGTIVPGVLGVGAWATTAQPARQGSSGEAQYNTEVIMQWDMVPNQSIANNDLVCVVAFKAPTPSAYAGGTKNDIIKVTIAAKGGTFLDITTPQINPKSNKLEYCGKLQTSGLSTNEQVELRAIGWPATGKPYVLQGAVWDGSSFYINETYALFMQANRSPTRFYLAASGGNDGNNCTAAGTPCATLTGIKAKAGAGDYSTVEMCLLAGTHDIFDSNIIRNNTVGFFEVKPCPGVAKANVTIGNIRPNVKKVRISGLTISGMSQYGQSQANTDNQVWFDDVDWTGGNGSCYNVFVNGGCRPINADSHKFDAGGIFITNSDFHYFYEGLIRAHLLRTVTLDHTNSDSFQNGKYLINVRTSDITFCCGAHPDVRQLTVSVGHSIIYGLTANSNIFAQGPVFTNVPASFSNQAFVDMVVDNFDAGYYGYAINGGCVSCGDPLYAGPTNSDNVFYWNNSMRSKLWTDRQINAGTNYVIQDSTCTGFSGMSSMSNYIVRGSTSCN